MDRLFQCALGMTFQSTGRQAACLSPELMQVLTDIGLILVYILNTQLTSSLDAR